MTTTTTSGTPGFLAGVYAMGEAGDVLYLTTETGGKLASRAGSRWKLTPTPSRGFRYETSDDALAALHRFAGGALMRFTVRPSDEAIGEQIVGAMRFYYDETDGCDESSGADDATFLYRLFGLLGLDVS